MCKEVGFVTSSKAIDLNEYLKTCAKLKLLSWSYWYVASYEELTKVLKSYERFYQDPGEINEQILVGVSQIWPDYYGELVRNEHRKDAETGREVMTYRFFLILKKLKLQPYILVYQYQYLEADTKYYVPKKMKKPKPQKPIVPLDDSGNQTPDPTPPGG